MQPAAPGQCWTYRAPEGFEHSRLIVGAIVDTESDVKIVCCSVTDAPWRLGAAPYEVLTIPFLPMTDAAFRATVVGLDGMMAPLSSFTNAFAQWRGDTSGLAAFTVPFEGFLDRMIELQKVWRRGATRRPSQEIGPALDAIRGLLAAGIDGPDRPMPHSKQEFEEVLASMRRFDPNDVKGILAMAGLRNHPAGQAQRRCLECTYFLPTYSWCDLPELSMPVEPYWSCRLWSI